MLYDPAARHEAKVRADGSIACAGAQGSIHKIGAHVQGATRLQRLDLLALPGRRTSHADRRFARGSAGEACPARLSRSTLPTKWTQGQEIRTLDHSEPRPILLDTGQVTNGSFTRRKAMDLYVIRRPSAWANLQELEAIGAKSTKVGNEMSDRVRWIRTYIVKEPDGKFGSVCIYQARDPEFDPRPCKARQHARRPDLPGGQDHHRSRRSSGRKRCSLIAPARERKR